MSDGGYDEGYSVCPKFWGDSPARLVQLALAELAQASTKRALDLGCGDGKNALAMARAGFRTLALDISGAAIANAMARTIDQLITWLVCDIRHIKGPDETFELVIATGSLHCLGNRAQVQDVINVMKRMTRPGGLNVISSFNDGPQDMSGHSSQFRPILLPHSFYTGCYSDWKIVDQSDSVLMDVHPHNNIQHQHSITRLLARRPSNSASGNDRLATQS